MLTEQARRQLFPGREDQDEKGRPIEVIPCCVDLGRFDSLEGRNELRRNLGFEGRRVIIYVGALGGWYLTDELVSFLSVAQEADPSTLPIILTQSDKGMIIEKLELAGVSDYRVLRVTPASQIQ